MDESREIRIDSGQVIGLIMLLLAMLPRDIRSDLVNRLHRMTTQEMLAGMKIQMRLETQQWTLLLREKYLSPRYQPLLENISLRQKCRSLSRMKEIRCSNESTNR